MRVRVRAGGRGAVCACVHAGILASVGVFTSPEDGVTLSRPGVCVSSREGGVYTVGNASSGLHGAPFEARATAGPEPALHRSTASSRHVAFKARNDQDTLHLKSTK